MTSLQRFALTLLFVGSAGTVLAQKDAADRSLVHDALQYRIDLAAAVAKGDVPASAAVARLKTRGAAGGLKLEADADNAVAAIDVGRRLVAFGNVKEAEEFFREAEKLLVQVIKRTPDSAADFKAMLLVQLGTIRAQYLGEDSAAKSDFDAALTLRPDDERLKRRRAEVGSGHGNAFGDHRGNSEPKH